MAVWLGDTAPFLPVVRPELESSNGKRGNCSLTQRGEQTGKEVDLMMALKVFFDSYARAAAAIRKVQTKRPRVSS